MDHSDTQSEEKRPWPRARLEELGRLLVELGLLSSARAWSDALGGRNASDPAELLRSIPRAFAPDGKVSPVAVGSVPPESAFTEFQIQRIVRGEARSLRVADYLLVDELGRGGMGHVYRARDLVLGHQVALKVLVDGGDPAERQLVLERFKREARLLANLRHPNLTTLYSARFEGAVAYLAMELVTGQTLTRYVRQHAERNNPVGLDWAIECIRGIAGALTVAHAHGCVHRDVTPNNIMVTEDRFHFKLLDLGIASLRRTVQTGAALHDRTLTRPGELMGSPPYMPPEQWSGDQVDERADVYALGATFYFVLTGSSPYDASDTFGMYLAHMQRPIPRVRDKRKDVPRRVDELIARMLAKRPEQRIGTMAEVVETLSRVRSPGVGKSRRLWTGIGAALLIGVLALGWVIRGLTFPANSESSPPPAPPALPTAWLAEHFSGNRFVWESFAALTEYAGTRGAKPEEVQGLIEAESRRRWRGEADGALFRFQQAHREIWESPDLLRQVVERRMDLAAIRDSQSLAALEEACLQATALRRETRAWLARGWDLWLSLLAQSLPMRDPRDVLLRPIVESTGFLVPFQLTGPIDRKLDWELVARRQLYRWVLGQGTKPTDRGGSVGLKFRFQANLEKFVHPIKIVHDQIEIPPEEGQLEITVSSERDAFLTMVVLREGAEDYLRVYQRSVNKSQQILQSVDARPMGDRIHFLLTDEPLLKHLKDGVREKAILRAQDNLARPYLQLDIEAMARADRVRNPGLTRLAHRLLWRGESVTVLRSGPNIRAARTIDVKVR